jgi:uncharacterized protein with PQ loop repeat
VLSVHITKETAHLTFMWILLVLTAQSLLLIYGLINNSYGIYLPASILIVGVTYILYIKLTHIKNENVEDELRGKDIFVK